MLLVIKGKEYYLSNITKPIDKAFKKIYSSYLGDGTYTWNDFHEIVQSFFDDEYENFKLHNEYFNNFTIIWKQYLNSGEYDEAEKIWNLALNPAIFWENENPGKFIHKGTPYYFWGMTAIIKGDYDKGYTLMHRSLQEDVRTSKSKYPNTPAFAFATADNKKIDQAFREWPTQQARFINDRLESYRNANGKSLLFEDFRNKFLCQPPNIDVVYLYAFTVAKLMKIEAMNRDLKHSDFISQLQSNLLFNITQIIDAVIKEINKKEWRYVDHMAYLSKKTGLGLNKNKLRNLNGDFRNDFNKTIRRIMNGKYKFKDGTSLNGLALDLAISYGIRNRGAHDITSTSIIAELFVSLERMTLNTLFLSIEELY